METYFYFVITPDARVYRVEIKSGRIPELDELQKSVQGYIETVSGRLATGDGQHLIPIVGIVNEEGRLQALADNPMASLVLRYPEPLAGNVVILQADGEDLVGFSSKEANEIGPMIYRIRNLYAVYFSNGGTA